MRNKKMEKYRDSLINSKSDYIYKLSEINRQIDELIPTYKINCEGAFDNNIIRKINRKIFGDLIKNNRHLEDKIEKINIELIEKKYANRYLYSDIEPYEVVEEITPNKYKIRWMKSVQTEDSKQKLKDSFVVGGFFGHYDNNLQEWDITPCETSQPFAIRRHKDGNWYDIYHCRYSISNKPIKFYDFNF